MLNPTKILADALGNHLENYYIAMFGPEEPSYPAKLNLAARMILEAIANSDDLADQYPRFYWNAVQPYIKDAIRYLQLTQDGKQWLANLYANVFAIEHKQSRFGPHPGEDRIDRSNQP